MSGDDIPFPTARVTIHTPKLREIGYIGEKNFHIGSQFLIFSKDDLSAEDKSNLADQSDFNIFMSVINSREKAIYKTDAMMVLALLFPQYKIKINKDKILLQLENFESSINEQNFNDFKSIINQLFCLRDSEAMVDDFNPADELASKIAEKIKKARNKRNQTKAGNEDQDFSLYAKYVSILSVGLGKDQNELMDYSVYQIRNEFQRYILKQDFDIYLQAKLAGAQDLEEAKNWMDDIHP